MKAQQLATILLPLFFCVQGQRYVPYGLGLGGIPSGQVPPENIIRAPPLPNAPASPGQAVNYNLPIGISYKRPEGEYGIASVVQNGRVAIPNGASVASNGNGRLAQVLGLGSLYVERGANGASLTHPGRLVRIQKRSADESVDAPGSPPETKLGDAPTYRKREEYDHGSLYRLAKEALKKNPRKGISFKKAEGKYGIASIHEGSTLPRSVDAEELKKLEDKINQEYAVQKKAPSSPADLLKFIEVPLEYPTGVSFEKPEGAYGVAPAFYPFHSRHRRQAVGSGSVTAVLVDFDRDGDDAGPPATNSFAPVVGFTVREPEGGTPSKHILKNVVFRKRPDGVKPTLSSEVPKKHVLRIPDSIELPPLGVAPRRTAEESPDLQTVALPAAQRASQRPTSRKPTSVATIEFRPTFPVEHIRPALPPLPTSPPRTSKPSTSHSHSHDGALKKTPPKAPADSHKLEATPLVAVPPGQVVYNRQLASSVPVQPVRKLSVPSRPPAVPTLRPAPTGQQYLTQPQIRPAPQQTIQVRQQLQPQATVITQPPAPQIHAVPQPQAVASPYPGALYQQYTPFDPSTYQVPQPVQTFQPTHYTLPYSAVVADPYIQARIARSTAARQQASAFDASSVYDLSRRIIQGVHS